MLNIDINPSCVPFLLLFWVAVLLEHNSSHRWQFCCRLQQVFCKNFLAMQHSFYLPLHKSMYREVSSQPPCFPMGMVKYSRGLEFS